MNYARSLQNDNFNDATRTALQMNAPLGAEVPGATHQELAPHFQRMQEQLKKTSTLIESSVVEVCGSFQAMAERARATVDQTAAFLECDTSSQSAGNSFEDLISSCSDTLVRTLEGSEEAAEVSDRAIERVTGISSVSQEIFKRLEKLEKIARENRMLSMNARIEAMHAGEHGAGFGIVAVEVATQSDRARDVTDEVNKLVTGLRDQANSTVKDLCAATQRERQRLEHSRAEVDEILTALRSTHQEMKRKLASMNEQSALLAKDIGAAVKELQFQDRVNQQIAHVVQDLDAISMRIDGHGAEFSSYTMREEREIAGISGAESQAGDVELF